MELTYFLMSNDALIATPDCFASSQRTQDISFFDLAEDYDLQTKANMASAVFIRPCYSWSKPSTGSDLHKNVASYLAKFKPIPEQSTVNAFLMTNPVIRILWLHHENHN